MPRSRPGQGHPRCRCTVTAVFIPRGCWPWVLPLVSRGGPRKFLSSGWCQGRGRGQGGAEKLGVGRGLPGKGGASPPGRSGGRRRAGLASQRADSARPCALGRRRARSLAQLRSRLRGWAPGPTRAVAGRPALPPAPLPHRNRSGAGGAARAREQKSGGLQVWKVSGILRPATPSWRWGVGGGHPGPGAAAADFWEAPALPPGSRLPSTLTQVAWRSHFSGGNLRENGRGRRRALYRPYQFPAGSV